jgi:hemerythrin-like metal-binding protein
MNKLTFSENWLVGHKQIDAEHKELFVQINRMIEDLDIRNPDKLKSDLSHFCGEVIRHCDHEIQIMKDVGYSEALHEDGHDAVIDELEAISATVAEYNMEQKLSDVINIFVRKILMSDIYFGDYLTKIKFQN